MSSAMDAADLRRRLMELLERIKVKIDKATVTPYYLYRNDYAAIRGMLAPDSSDRPVANQLLNVEFTTITDLSTLTTEILEWKRVNEHCIALIEYCNKRLRMAYTVCAHVKSDLVDLLLLPMTLLMHKAMNRMAVIVGI